MSDREGSATGDRKPKPEGVPSHPPRLDFALESATAPLTNTSGEAAGGDALNIKIVSTNGDEVFFKIKKTTKLNKLKVS